MYLSFGPLLPTDALCVPHCISSFATVSTYKLQGMRTHFGDLGQWELVVGFQRAMKRTGSGFSSLSQAASLKTSARAWTQKQLWGPGRNSEHRAEKRACAWPPRRAFGCRLQAPLPLPCHPAALSDPCPSALTSILFLHLSPIRVTFPVS